MALVGFAYASAVHEEGRSSSLAERPRLIGGTTGATGPKGGALIESSTGFLELGTTRR